MKKQYGGAADAYILGDGDHPGLRGRVQFIPVSGGTLVIADIHGLPDSETGFFAFHIHEGDGCTGSGFANTGGHYNPQNKDHPNHAGDLPPLLSGGGRGYLEVFTNRFQVEEVIGRTVVIHSGPDDFKTQPAGNPGEKIACGVITG